ncbi:hypothetical protein EYF80_034428 [Liparis tanakae]|uniref:Uncharacterized protein n=1 Tax=Liparis tanakae TaxID=230148 RepID=A0A4Z2GQI2_9TELE|nr:hypothetical protein EYF80_034428 [Liparis tanakae]
MCNIGLLSKRKTCYDFTAAFRLDKGAFCTLGSSAGRRPASDFPPYKDDPKKNPERRFVTAAR